MDHLFYATTYAVTFSKWFIACGSMVLPYFNVRGYWLRRARRSQ
jgi:hypothetical protein